MIASPLFTSWPQPSNFSALQVSGVRVPFFVVLRIEVPVLVRVYGFTANLILGYPKP